MQERIRQVRENIRQSAIKSGRKPSDISLVAVSKTRSVTEIEAAYAHGIKSFGENRVQELRNKFEQLPDFNWHMVGSLQTNKVKYIVGKIKLLHSLDRLSLAEEIDKRARQKGIVMPVLVQVNVAKEASKSGLACEEVYDFCVAVSDYTNLRIEGLMTMAPYCRNPEQVRVVFRELAQLRARLQHKVPRNIGLSELSMGMSGDYQVAIEEGATIIRVGTAIFG